MKNLQNWTTYSKISLLTQAIAWTTAAYPFGVPNQIPTRDTEGHIPGTDMEPVKEKTSPRLESTN